VHRPGLSRRSPRRHWPLALGAAALVLGAVAVGAFLTTRDSAGGLSGVDPNYVGVIDPETSAIVAAVPVGIRPGPMVAGAGSVWVGNLDDRNLTRVDPAELSPAATVSLDDRTPTGLAFGAGAVWVAHGLSGELTRVEPQFDQAAERISVTPRPFTSPNGSVAVGAGSVWAVYGDSTLARIEPASMRPSGSALAGGSPAAVVFGSGAVWVANSGGATVERFHPETFEQGAIRAISVGRRPSGLAYGQGAVWVANRGDDTLTRIDPGTGATLTMRVGDEPVAVAVGAGSVWVANAGDGTVTRFDPEAGEIDETIDVGNAPAGIAVADGAVWVAVQAP
jgi:streptogramin lyase